jgi:lysophospholipase L1-like esterase
MSTDRTRTRLALMSAVLLLATAAAPAAATRFLAFGDSITAGVGFDDCACQCLEACGYPHRLELLLRDAGVTAEITNAGFGGERTPEGLIRIDQELPGHDVLLLMHGSNDISREISLETTLFNLNVMAEKAEGRGMSVVHATLIPRIPTAVQDFDNVVNERLAWRLRELAYNRGRGLVDPFEVLGQVPNLFDTLYHPGNGDVVGHPNPEGFQRLAETFFDVIQGVDSVPPVLGLVSPLDGSRDVPANVELRIRLFDFGEGIDVAATELLVGGAPVSANKAGDTEILDLRYQAPGGFQGQVEVGYRTRDLANPRNQAERQVAKILIAGTSFLPGDINRDGRVDGADLLRLARAFGAQIGQPRYDPAADLDGNGVIDGMDLAILAENFGQSSL